MNSTKILKEAIDCDVNNLVLKWDNLTCTVMNNNETTKNILNNVSGSVRSKSFTAILGPSGAGKTTFLEGISCRSLSVRGTVSINGYLVSNAFMKEISGFLPQQDIAHDCLTIKEHLHFVCTMKMHNTISSWEQDLRIKNIINLLGLEKCCDTQLSKLSGGERRRLFLGTELLSDPAIIFCDEPTTGLDSYNALQIISILRNLSLSGKIVIISIHQPSSDLIEYFDNLILLTRGTVILEGSEKHITSFFHEMNITCPKTFNIAEFYIQQISVKPGDEENSIKRITDINNKFLQYQKLKNKSPAVICQVWKKIYWKEKLKCPYLVQFVWLIWRESVVLKKEILTEIITFSILIITAFVIAIFYSSAEHSLDKTHDLDGFLYLIVSELLFTATYSVLHTFPQEIPIFKSEKDLYSSTIYYFVKICTKVPHIIIYPYSFLFILYFIVPFNFDILLCLKIGFVMCIASFTATAYGFLLSTLSDSTDYINLITVPMDTIFLITSGIFLKLDTLPFLFKWLKYISSFFYAFDAISILYWFKSNYTELIDETHIEYLDNDSHNFNYDLYSLIILATLMHGLGCFTLIRKKKKY